MRHRVPLLGKFFFKTFTYLRGVAELVPWNNKKFMLTRPIGFKKIS